MNAPLMKDVAEEAITSEMLDAFTRACSYIAPTWPLDQMIAVNPLWELRHLDYQEASARISALGDIRTHLSTDFYGDSVAPEVLPRHLEAAADHLNSAQEAISGNGEALTHWLNVSDLLDRDRDEHQMSWDEEIIHQISQFCADSFRDSGPCAGEAAPGSLYSLWLANIRNNHGLSIVMGTPGIREVFLALPDDPQQLLSLASSELKLTVESAEHYAHALLMHVNGWASWVAYKRWQARLQDRDHDLTSDLLAMRMAWDLALWRHSQHEHNTEFRRLQHVWQRQIAAPELLLQQHRNAQKECWQWQTAAELAYQEKMAGLLRRSHKPKALAPSLQAVFCIDVRSEVIRRHLESQNPVIQTKGFAGFFGLPIQYQTADGAFARPQLPGLLAPTLTLRADRQQEPSARNRRLGAWFATAESPAAMFGLVETSGPFYLWKMLRDSFSPKAISDPARALADDSTMELCSEGEVLPLADRVELAAGILHAMGLERDFAPIVMLVGHGAETPNNPHAASLNCGACGGQSGELNSLLLSKLLNDPATRKGLAETGVRIPEKTRFIAVLHETVTDELRVVDGSELPGHVTGWLQQASAATRRERAGKLGLTATSDNELAEDLCRRSKDWSQVRPEWGLADNAAFIVAPRDKTRGLDLEGRAFLHDYHWQQDEDLSVLELIMTAPMVVTHWINMQYNASVADNDRYGSGNKVLHNVVGGSLGVFEGNGGDLRIGLPLQSVHDGEQWMHTPLRLSVYIAAPTEAIEEIYRRHLVVRQLVDNGWLYLFSLNDDGECCRLYQDKWTDWSCSQ